MKYYAVGLYTLHCPRFREFRVKAPMVTLMLPSQGVTAVFCYVITSSQRAKFSSAYLLFHLQTPLWSPWGLGMGRGQTYHRRIKPWAFKTTKWHICVHFLSVRKGFKGHHLATWWWLLEELWARKECELSCLCKSHSVSCHQLVYSCWIKASIVQER